MNSQYLLDRIDKLQEKVESLQDQVDFLQNQIQYFHKKRMNDLGTISRILGVLTEILYSKDISQETRDNILNKYPTYKKSDNDD